MSVYSVQAVRQARTTQNERGCASSTRLEITKENFKGKELIGCIALNCGVKPFTTNWNVK
jgi:hypothetical protein